MFCPNCGAQVEDGTAFCSNCGAKIEAAQPQNVVQPESQVQPGEDNFYQQPAQEPKVSKKNIKMILLRQKLMKLFAEKQDHSQMDF